MECGWGMSQLATIQQREIIPTFFVENVTCMILVITLELRMQNDELHTIASMVSSRIRILRLLIDA